MRFTQYQLRQLTHLATQARQGNQQALHELIHMLRPWLAQLAEHFGQLAEDLTQEAIVLMMKNIQRLRRPEAVLGWAKGCLQQAGKQMLRNQRRQQKIRQELGQLWKEASYGAGPVQALLLDERSRVIQEQLAQLPDHLRLAAEAHYLENCSVQEISRRLGCPVGTVKRRLHDARRQLRQAEVLLAI